MSTTLEVGKKLVSLTEAGRNIDAVDTLYADCIISVEAMAMPGHPQTTTGKAAVREKNVTWLADHDIHGHTVMGPWPHGDRFIVYFKMDVTPKAGPMAGRRMTIEEGALYTVKDGQIVKEEFFYDFGG